MSASSVVSATKPVGTAVSRCRLTKRSNATATSGSAYGFGENYEAIEQNATGNAGADASASLTSAGTLNITAVGNANGVTGADASAYNDYAIYQNAVANGGGDASANITLAGANIAASANAVATSGSATATVSVT